MRLGTRPRNATRREELDDSSVGTCGTSPSHRGHVGGVYFQNMIPAITKVQVVWIYFEDSTSSMHATVLLQTVCNALV